VQRDSKILPGGVEGGNVQDNRAIMEELGDKADNEGEIVEGRGGHYHGRRT